MYSYPQNIYTRYYTSKPSSQSSTAYLKCASVPPCRHRKFSKTFLSAICYGMLGKNINSCSAGNKV